jgi:hypothetical protein
MRYHRLIGLSTVAALAAAGALVLTLTLRGGSESTPSEEELAAIAEEINKEVPNVGLGEGSPPPDSDDWGTDFSKSSVPLQEIQSGGPSKDGIPAIDEPRYLQVKDVDFLEDREPVIVVAGDDVTHAYPIQILMWHEIVNARLGDTLVAVTFCPLCNTAIVFDRRVGARSLDFGTTGKLRDSDLVMYDRQTESWWQQFSGEAVVGELTGVTLREIPARIVSWEEFQREHPEGLVLSRDTGFTRDYGLNPYSGYDRIDSSPLFATRNADDDRLPPKERVVYVEVAESAYAVPFSSLATKRTIAIETQRGTVVVRWRSGVASALDNGVIALGRDVGASSVLLEGEPIPFHEPFWFAVAAFRPDIEIVDG